jgi:hypothetical protein
MLGVPGINAGNSTAFFAAITRSFRSFISTGQASTFPLVLLRCFQRIGREVTRQRAGIAGPFVQAQVLRRAVKRPQWRILEGARRVESLWAQRARASGRHRPCGGSIRKKGVCNESGLGHHKRTRPS